jgi:hypothetical protein
LGEGQSDPLLVARGQVRGEPRVVRVVGAWAGSWHRATPQRTFLASSARPYALAVADPERRAGQAGRLDLAANHCYATLGQTMSRGLLMPKVDPVTLHQVQDAFQRYTDAVEQSGLRVASKENYIRHARAFIRWLHD